MFHLLLSVLKPLLLKKRMTRTVLRMVPAMKVMQMMTSYTTRMKKLVDVSSSNWYSSSRSEEVAFIVDSENQHIKSNLEQS